MSYEKERNVNIYADGQLVTSAHNVITNEAVSKDIKLERFVPVTLEIEADSNFIKQLGE